MKKIIILLFCFALLMLIACNNGSIDTSQNDNSLKEDLKDGQYLVTFDLNGGSGEAKAQIVNKRYNAKRCYSFS